MKNPLQITFKWLLVIIFSFFHINGFSQNTSSEGLKIEIELSNPSKEINDGIAEAKVSGGTPPYEYKWTNKNTALDASTSTGLTEGVEYSLKVTDANGQTATEHFKLKAKAITEIFNSAVQPAVDVLGSVLFWDPFSSIGVYDPVVYITKKDVTLPVNIKDVNQRKYYLKEWLVPDNTQVETDQKIAIIVHDETQLDTVYASTHGTLQQNLETGSLISPKTETIKVTPKTLGKINFDKKRPIYHPNGDKKKSTIPFIVIWLILGSIFFTLRLKFVNIRGFFHSIALAKGKYDDPDAPGTITHFQAMATAVSATVGLGNIAGVAVAVSLGGAGATFWMFIAGFFGMSLKFAECAMGVKYRFITKDGRIFGGPMNYLRHGLEKRNMKKLGKFLAIFFAVLGIGASFGGGNMLQSNQAFKIVSEQIPVLKGQGFWFGIGFALLVGAVIIGGIKSIAKVTAKVVPFMAMLYILGCLIVIGVNIDHIGSAFAAIFNGAFSADALRGGFVGVLIVGLQRAAFSSEAGVGSAAIAHSASKTNHPIADGFTALIEPFIDTMVVCTMTALVLIFTGVHETSEGMGGVELTADAFGSVVSWFPVVLAIAVFLFAFSTMISWSYYGMRSWTYVFGRSKKGELIYKLMYLCVIVLGASVSLGAALSFADMMILAMSFPNIIGLYILAPEISADMKKYWKKLKEGKLYINPKFIKD